MADSLLLWIDDRIDTLVEANPKLKVASVYLKRGAKNYIAKERDNLNTMIDNASLFCAMKTATLMRICCLMTS